MQSPSTSTSAKLGRTAVIVASGSRQGEDVYIALLEAFPDRFHSITQVDGMDEFRAASEAAIASGAQILAVAGGDGTFGKAAQTCASNHLTLAIIPAGTGNALARELGIPLDPIEAVQLIEAGEVREIDLGECDGHPFVTVMTLGISTEIAKTLESFGKARLGRLSYVPAILRAASRVKPTYVLLDADGQRFEGYVVELVVASSRLHGGPFQVTDLARIDDGLLSVYAVEAHGLAARVKYALYLVRGRQTDLTNVWSAEARRLQIRLNSKKNFVLDGDLYAASEAQVVSHHRALRVITPPRSPSNAMDQR